MLQNNKSSDSRQEDQHQQSFISPLVNSDDKTVRKENGKAGKLYKSQLRSLQKMQKKQNLFHKEKDETNKRRN